VRFNRSVHNITETLEKETASLVVYLNDEVVPAVRKREDERSSPGQVRGTEGGSRMTPWHKATRVELVAEIDRLTRVNAEIRAELALRDASDGTAMVVKPRKTKPKVDS